MEKLIFIIIIIFLLFSKDKPSNEKLLLKNLGELQTVTTEYLEVIKRQKDEIEALKDSIAVRKIYSKAVLDKLQFVSFEMGYNLSYLNTSRGMMNSYGEYRLQWGKDSIWMRNVLKHQNTE